jgi:hypothetical protein
MSLLTYSLVVSVAITLVAIALWSSDGDGFSRA